MTDEDDVWAAYTKSVKPLSSVKNLTKKSKASPKRNSPQPNPPLSAKASADKRERYTPHDHPLDHNLEKKMRQGAVSIDARLDLHGMKQDEAHQALESFIARQVKAGKRSLLVITGKGRGNEGVLRNNLGKWLAASLHARHILALRPAAIKHGGAGAFYVILRRVTK